MSEPSRSSPRQLIDDLVPDHFDFEQLVREYPLPVLAPAFVGGFVLGRSHGRVVLDALSAFAAAQVASQVNQVLGEDVLDAS